MWRRSEVSGPAPAPRNGAHDVGFQKRAVLLPSWPSLSACDGRAWKWLAPARNKRSPGTPGITSPDSSIPQRRWAIHHLTGEYLAWAEKQRTAKG